MKNKPTTKTKYGGRQDWARVTINLQPEVAEHLKHFAARDRRSVSALCALLVERHLQAQAPGDTQPPRESQPRA